MYLSKGLGSPAPYSTTSHQGSPRCLQTLLKFSKLVEGFTWNFFQQLSAKRKRHKVGCPLEKCELAKTVRPLSSQGTLPMFSSELDEGLPFYPHFPPEPSALNSYICIHAYQSLPNAKMTAPEGEQSKRSTRRWRTITSPKGEQSKRSTRRWRTITSASRDPDQKESRASAPRGGGERSHQLRVIQIKRRAEQALHAEVENDHITKRRAEQALHAEVENDHITKRRAEQAFHEEVENDHISFAVIQIKRRTEQALHAEVENDHISFAVIQIKRRAEQALHAEVENDHISFAVIQQKESRASVPREGGE
ncbi:hypothetical protein E5288_WYG022010 [Bos mutus]|uniref:Uncharacterized protein n=1 Tax=Bos mutus TaxID=72004 RepID=A0A6B0S2X6_9CETA|nr:hypothetical protein [Bos mutus]